MSEFTTQKKDKMHIIVLPNFLNENLIESLKVNIKQWLMESESLHVFDFKSAAILSNKLYVHLINFSRDLKANGKKLYSVNMNSEIFKQIKSDGLEDILNPIKNFDELHSKLQQARKNLLSVDFVNPFVKACSETISVQAKTPIEVGKPFMKTKSFEPNIAICGVISIASDIFRGSVILAFSKEAFLLVYENMIGEKHSEITQEIQDACGELLNIIFGQAKAQLNNEKGYNIQKAIPTVLSGEKVKVLQTINQPVMVLPMKIAQGEIYLEIATEPN